MIEGTAKLFTRVLDFIDQRNNVRIKAAKAKKTGMDTLEGLTLLDWQSVIRGEDACNLSGVVQNWARIMGKLCKYAHSARLNFKWVNKHPVNVSFADKVYNLTNCTNSIAKAHNQIEQAIQKLTPKE